MAATNMVGDDGQVEFGASIVAGVTSWSVDVTMDTAETTAMGDGGWKSFISSNKGWTASCEVIISLDDLSGADSTATAVGIGDSAVLELFGDKDGTGASYSGTALVTGYSVSSAIGDTIKASVTFQGTSTLTGV